MGGPYPNNFLKRSVDVLSEIGGYSFANDVDNCDAEHHNKRAGTLVNLVDRARSVVSVKDYGAKGDGATDDSAAIIAATNAANKANGGPGVVYVPSGTYLVRRENVSTRASFEIRGNVGGFSINQITSDIAFIGDGVSSVLKMDPGWDPVSGDWYIFRLTGGVKRVTFDGLHFDGSKGAAHGNFNEQTHAIRIEDAQEVVIRDCWFSDTYGDGIFGFANIPGTNTTEYVQILGCHFRDNGRSGITVQRNFDLVQITGCTFKGVSDQSIDFEPTGGERAHRLIITHNIIHSTTETGCLTLGISDDVIFANNYVEGVVQTGGTINRMIFANNNVSGLVPDPADATWTAKSGLHMLKQIRRLIIADNYIQAESANTGIVGDTPGAAINLAHQSAKHAADVTIVGNTLVGGTGVNSVSAERLVVAGNTIIDLTAPDADPDGVGVNIEGAGLTGHQPSNFIIAHNNISGFKFSAKIVASFENVARAVVQGNICEGRREIRTLTVSAAHDGTGTEQATVTVNGTPYTVTFPADASPTIAETADFLAGDLTSQADGFRFVSDGVDAVTMTAEGEGAKSGSYAFSSATAAAAWAQVQAGTTPSPHILIDGKTTQDVSSVMCSGNIGTVGRQGGVTAMMVGGNEGDVTQWVGEGSPESVVTANVGSMYLRTDGGTGTSMYIKESGSGSTGWAAK